MEVSAAGSGQANMIQKAGGADKASVGMLKQALSVEKAQGAQMIDMIKKAGSVIDTVA